jgi:hypothetical protein
MLLQESTPTELQRVFAEIAHDQPDAIMVQGSAALTAHHQLIVELANKSRLPAMYPWRDYVEAGGLMAYGGDLSELCALPMTRTRSSTGRNRGHSDLSTDQVRTRHQSEGRQGARPHHPAIDPRPRRRGDRISRIAANL